MKALVPFVILLFKNEEIAQKRNGRNSEGKVFRKMKGRTKRGEVKKKT